MIAPGEHMKNRLSRYQDDGSLQSAYEFSRKQTDESERSFGVVTKTTESLIAVAKRKPEAVVVAGVVAGVVVAWLVKRKF